MSPTRDNEKKYSVIIILLHVVKLYYKFTRFTFCIIFVKFLDFNFFFFTSIRLYKILLDSYFFFSTCKNIFFYLSHLLHLRWYVLHFESFSLKIFRICFDQFNSICWNNIYIYNKHIFLKSTFFQKYLFSVCKMPIK